MLAPKLDQIAAAGVDYVVAVNPGCLRQVATGLRKRRSSVRALHLAELLDLAARGDRRSRRGRGPIRPLVRVMAALPADETAPLTADLNDRPAPDNPGASGAGRPGAMES